MLKRMREIENQALKKISEQEVEEGKQKLGVVRGGSSGALVEGKSYAAKCARLDQARLRGVQKPIDPGTRVMFSAGLGHELYMESMFKNAGIEYKREQTHYAELETANGPMVWSGRPDFELNLDGEWVGVEAKALVSNFSVSKQTDADWPFMRHIVQAAAYMLALKKDKWLICIGHYFYAQANYGPKHDPAIRWYKVVAASDGELSVHNEAGEIMPLPFKLEHTLAYYASLSQRNAKLELAERPTEFELGMKSYNRCNYCPMKNSCNQYDAGQLSYDEWMEKLKGE